MVAVDLYGLTVGALVVGLSVGYAVGWVEGATDRWLWKRLVVPLILRLRRHALARGERRPYR
jgi:hypothetical protein